MSSLHVYYPLWNFTFFLYISFIHVISNVLCILYAPIWCYLFGFFPSWRVFFHSLSYFALHGVFPWSVQSYQRPKSVVVCVHCSRFDCECLSTVQLVSLCSTWTLSVVYSHWTGLVDWTKNHFYALRWELPCRIALGNHSHFPSQALARIFRCHEAYAHLANPMKSTGKPQGTPPLGRTNFAWNVYLLATWLHTRLTMLTDWVL